MKNWLKVIFLLSAVVIVSITVSFISFSFFRQTIGENNYDAKNENIFNQKYFQLTSAKQEDNYPDFTKAVENTVNGVVHIKSIAKSRQSQNRRQMNPFGFFFGFPEDDAPNNQMPEKAGSGIVVGTGSGVIISEDGFIITNNHVIEKASEIEITMNDNSKYTGTIVGTDPNTDVALLKIESNKKLNYVPFGDSDKLKVGEWVIAVGNPFNLTSTVTKGIVSAKARGNIGSESRNSIQSFIQTDAAINPGNSGGALINTEGELVGINTAIYSHTGSFTGYGFAIPISIAKKIASDLKEFGAVQRAMLGIGIMNLNDIREYDEMKKKLENIKINEGVYIDNFDNLSPAKKAGLEPGDIITDIDGIKIPSTSVLQEYISRYRPGDKINVKVNRNNEEKSFDVVLTNLQGNTETVKKEDAPTNIGVTFKNASPEKLKARGLSYGAEIESVTKGSTFYLKGITPGYIVLEIDRVPVKNATEAKNIIESKMKDKNSYDVILLKLAGPHGEKRFEAIELK